MLAFFKKIALLVLPEQKIWAIKNRHHIPSMEWSLWNIKRQGFNPEFAIDVGAFDGEWSGMFKKIFPAAKILMVEAQPEKEEVLKSVTASLTGTSYHIALLGAECGKEVVFHVNATVSSVLDEYKPNTFKKEPRKLETLDDIVLAKFNNNKSPDFIKLDVQGYELEVLKGASKTLANIQFVLCEVSLIEINKGAPLIADVIHFLRDRGFIVYDICSFIRRPLDNALWQTDLLFIRETNPLIQNKYWD